MDTTYKFIAAFVTLLLGIVIVGVISTNITAITDPIIVANESLDITSLRIAGGALNSSINLSIANVATGWRTTDSGGACLPGSNTFALRNQTGATMTAGGTDYTIFPTGLISLQNSASLNKTGNITTVTYQYCGPGYLNSSWGQSVLNIVAGFFAIALLLISVGLFYSIAKDYKII